MNNKKNKGSLLIEVLVAVAVIGGSITFVLGASALILRLTSHTFQSVQATYLVEEGVERMRAIRDTDWETFSAYDTGTEYGMSGDGTLTLGEEEVLVYGSRTVVFEPVYRSESDQLAESGTPDTNTRKVVVTVELPFMVPFVAETYLSNIHE
ncbi:MAG: hypothetical protein Q8P93_04860 [bacterium]|nr:hypothetical protein [bacterium]